MDELFTVNRLDLPGSLRRCLSSTNLIDSSGSGARQKTHRVTNWQSGAMALRWAAAAFVETEKNYRRIMGYQQLWMLKATLDEPREDQSNGQSDGQTIADKRKTG
jgi:putative transposase